MTSLLPPNTTPLERRLAEVATDLERASAPLDALWDAQRVPAHMLPWLGWAVGVDHWNRRWSEQAKRDAIGEAIPIRRLRGTVWAVRRALEVLGYSDVEILEHARQDAEWRAAGGLYLDGGWALDGRSMEVVDAPRVVTTHWAQYALAFNIADAPFEARDQRRIRDRVEAAAPLRSELIALIYRYAASWSARITLSPLSLTIRQRWSECAGAQVHSARLIMGCWSLSGGYAPRLLSGRERLRGWFTLTGQTAAGEPLNHGWGSAAIRIRQPTALGMQAVSGNDWTLGESRTDSLDSSWRLNEVVDGHRRLDNSYQLELSQLHRTQRPTLNGARNLSHRRALSSIGTTARAVMRDRRLRTEIRL